MLFTAPTPFNTILWQWMNQTYNANLNYGNRNASSNYTTTDILKGYILASTSSVSVAMFVRKILDGPTKRSKGAMLVFMNSLAAFSGCSSAGFLNAFFMRKSELTTGIDVLDPKDPTVVVGKSKVAAKAAVFETSFSRVVLTFPIFFPSVALYAVERINLMPKRSSH